MSRLAANGSWTLFDPADVPDLLCNHGSAFSAVYEQYEAAGLSTVHISASRVWSSLLDAQMESGTPFVMFADSVNGQYESPSLIARGTKLLRL